MSLFKYITQVELFHTDSTGALFYGALFPLVHQALSGFLKAKNTPLPELIEKDVLVCPVVHVEGDFQRPLTVGDEVVIEVKNGKVGTTSFTLEYEIYKGEQLSASAKIIHACLGKNNQKIEVPEKIRALFK